MRDTLTPVTQHLAVGTCTGRRVVALYGEDYRPSTWTAVEDAERFRGDR